MTVAPDRVEDATLFADEAAIVSVNDVLFLSENAGESKPESMPRLTFVVKSRGKLSARTEARGQGMIQRLCQDGADVGDPIDLALLSLLDNELIVGSQFPGIFGRGCGFAICFPKETLLALLVRESEREKKHWAVLPSRPRYRGLIGGIRAIGKPLPIFSHFLRLGDDFDGLRDGHGNIIFSIVIFTCFFPLSIVLGTAQCQSRIKTIQQG